MLADGADFEQENALQKYLDGSGSCSYVLVTVLDIVGSAPPSGQLAREGKGRAGKRPTACRIYVCCGRGCSIRRHLSTLDDGGYVDAAGSPGSSVEREAPRRVNDHVPLPLNDDALPENARSERWLYLVRIARSVRHRRGAPADGDGPKCARLRGLAAAARETEQRMLQQSLRRLRTKPARPSLTEARWRRERHGGSMTSE